MVSIPKRVSEALNLNKGVNLTVAQPVSIPKRVSEALNLPYTKVSSKIVDSFNP